HGSGLAQHASSLPLGQNGPIVPVWNSTSQTSHLSVCVCVCVYVCVCVCVCVLLSEFCLWIAARVRATHSARSHRVELRGCHTYTDTSPLITHPEPAYR